MMICSIKRKKTLSNNIMFAYHYYNNIENTLQFIENFFFIIFTVIMCFLSLNSTIYAISFAIGFIYIIINLYKHFMTFGNDKYKRKHDIFLFKLVTVFNWSKGKKKK